MVMELNEEKIIDKIVADGTDKEFIRQAIRNICACSNTVGNENVGTLHIFRTLNGLGLLSYEESFEVMKEVAQEFSPENVYVDYKLSDLIFNNGSYG
jgi:hypothetical protein